MKKIFVLLGLMISMGAGAQTFPSSDSLRNFIDKHIRNSAIQAFTNLRLNTALKGASRFTDSLANARVPLTRTLTINGTTLDLSANRSWTIAGIDTTSLSDRINGKQAQLNGTGFVKASGTTITYDNSSYQLADPDLTTYASITPTTVAQNLLAIANPSAVRFIRINADNTASTRTDAELKTDLSLSLVENTALSTWAGSANLTALGAIATGTWNATAIGATKGGTGLTTYATGDLIYSTAANVLGVLPGNTSATKQFLSQTGTGLVSAAPVWSVLAKADVGLGNVDNTSDLSKPISTATQTALDAKVNGNTAIVGAAKTKITYDAKGLVTAGADATTTDITEGTNLYYTDARSRAAISLTTTGTSGAATYNNTTGALNIPIYGDVTGPASATDNAITRFDLTTGKLIQNSSATLDDAGLLSTSGLSISGAATVSGALTASGGIQTSATATTFSNLYSNTTTAVSTSLAELQLGGSLNISARLWERGSSTPTLAVGNSYASHIIGSQTLTEAASGTHGLLSQLGIRSLNVTAGVGTVTDAATLYIEGASNAVVTGRNDAFRVNSGTSYFGGKTSYDATNTPTGTTGAQTIHKPSGTVNIAAAQTSIVVTNNLVTTSSLVFLTWGTDATALAPSVNVGAGSFTITFNQASTGEVRIGFLVIN